MNFTLTPAYGRDYKKKADVIADFNADKDFIDQSFNSSSRYINKAQIPIGANIQFRFGQLRKVAVHKVS